MVYYSLRLLNSHHCLLILDHSLHPLVFLVYVGVWVPWDNTQVNGNVWESILSFLWVPRMSDLSAFSHWASLCWASHGSAAGLSWTNHILIQRWRAASLWSHFCVNLVCFVFIVWVTVLLCSSGWSWICYPGCQQTCDLPPKSSFRVLWLCVSPIIHDPPPGLGHIYRCILGVSGTPQRSQQKGEEVPAQLDQFWRFIES